MSWMNGEFCLSCTEPQCVRSGAQRAGATCGAGRSQGTEQQGHMKRQGGTPRLPPQRCVTQSVACDMNQQSKLEQRSYAHCRPPGQGKARAPSDHAAWIGAGGCRSSYCDAACPRMQGAQRSARSEAAEQARAELVRDAESPSGHRAKQAHGAALRLARAQPKACTATRCAEALSAPQPQRDQRQLVLQRAALRAEPLCASALRTDALCANLVRFKPCSHSLSKRTQTLIRL